MGASDKSNTGGQSQPGGKNPRRNNAYGFTVSEVSEDSLSHAVKYKKPGSKKKPVVETGGVDPGRWEWRMLAIVLVALPLVYLLQHWTRQLRGETLGTAPIEVRQSEELRDPGVSDLTVTSKLAVKFAFVYELNGHRQPNKTLAEQKAEQSKDSPSGGDDNSSNADITDLDEELSVRGIERLAWTRTDRMRVAIVAGELDGAWAAISRLNALSTEATPDGDLASEITWLKMIYENGPDSIPAEARESLMSRHGWFGRLAVSFGKPKHDELRWSVVSGGEEIAKALNRTVVIVIIMSIFGLIGLLVSIFVILWLHRAGNLIMFEPPPPGGSVFLETFGIFLAGFAFLLLIDLMLFGMGVEGTIAALAIKEVLLWSLVAATAWPLLRGMKWRSWLHAVGWHRGSGIGREIGAGVLGYLCSQPIVWIGALIGVVVERLTDSADAESAFGYGLFDVPAQGSWLLFILGIMSAVIWAPIVEETIFRGSLFRYLSGRMRMVWATVISAILFGLIHPYSPSGLIQVASMGLVFGFMRAWRDSIIAAVTAHALHNALVSSMSVVLLTMLES